jgi:hypothetical protein
MSVKIKRLAYKLQTALCQKGRYIKINQLQAYSPKADKMVTKYVVVEKRTLPNGKKKDFVIMETYRMPDVVKKLAEMYGEKNEPYT